MNTVRTLLGDIQRVAPREGLESEIVQAVVSLRSAQLKRRLTFLYAGLVFSGIAIVSAGILYGGAFIGSEFWSVIALLFSDATVVVNYWNEFFLLLLETIPVIPLVLMLIPTFIFLMLLGMYARATQKHHYSF